MVYLGCHHIRMRANKNCTTYGLLKTMALSIMPWLVSVSPPKKWERVHMHYLVVTIPHKLSVELVVWRRLRTIQTGLELGLLRGKECIMDLNQCKSQVKTPRILQLLILVALNCQSLLMFLTRLAQIGQKLFLILIAQLMRLSVTLWKAANQYLKKLSLLVSKWVTTYLNYRQNNTCTKQTTTNAIL